MGTARQRCSYGSQRAEGGAAEERGPAETNAGRKENFMRDVVGYDLAAFFKRNSKTFRAEINAVLKALLTPDTT